MSATDEHDDDGSRFGCFGALVLVVVLPLMALASCTAFVVGYDNAAAERMDSLERTSSYDARVEIKYVQIGSAYSYFSTNQGRCTYRALTRHQDDDWYLRPGTEDLVEATNGGGCQPKPLLQFSGQ